MEIVVIPHPALRKISDVVPAADFGSEEIRRLCTNLSGAMATRDDGVGISAPQIAINLRIFAVSGKVWKKEKEDRPTPPDEYFINPVVTRSSKKLVTAEEGCLSIPETYGMVKRPSTVTIEYYSFDGEHRSVKATGLLARIFQHEIDHLDGILFTDKATHVRIAKDDKNNVEL